MIEELRNATTIFASWVISIGGAGAIFIGLYRWFKKPDVNRDEKIKGHDEKLDNDNRRIKELEKSRQDTDEAINILMQSMLALMSNAIDGNHKEELKIARDDLQKYLIKRR